MAAMRVHRRYVYSFGSPGGQVFQRLWNQIHCSGQRRIVASMRRAATRRI